MSEKIRCMVVDDEPLAIELLSEHIGQAPQLELIASARNPIDALSILKEKEIDLLFLDIQMPILTGIELVKTMNNPPGIIFTTAYREYAVESYELDVVDYLLKPITFMRFLKSVNKFIDGRSDHNPTSQTFPKVEDDKNYIYVNVNKRFVKVKFEDIQYVESVKDYIHIHVKDETVVTKEKISDFEIKLGSDFLRIHRSFIVNRKKITAFTAMDVELGRKELPIGASYKEKVKSTLSR